MHKPSTTLSLVFLLLPMAVCAQNSKPIWGIQVNPAPMVIYGWGAEIQPQFIIDQHFAFSLGYAQIFRNEPNYYQLKGQRVSLSTLWEVAEFLDDGQYWLGFTYRYRHLEAVSKPSPSNSGPLNPVLRERSQSQYFMVTNTLRWQVGKHFGADLSLHAGAKRSFHPDREDVHPLINYHLNAADGSKPVKWTPNIHVSVHLNFWITRYEN